MDYFVATIRMRGAAGGTGRGPRVAGRHVRGPDPRTAAARALVMDSPRRRRRVLDDIDVTAGKIAAVLVAAGHWTARPTAGLRLEAWAFCDPLGAAALLVVRVSVRPRGERVGPSPN